MKYVLALWLILASPAYARILGEFLRVDPHALPGDTEYNHLPLPGIHLHEANDWYGNTDKLMSGLGTLSISGIWKHFSTSLSGKGRLYTPILQTRNDQPDLTNKIGVFADSMETAWHNSITIYGQDSLGLKLNFGLAYTDVGNHGLVSLYQDIHKTLGYESLEDRWGSRLKDSFITTTYGGAIIFPLADSLNVLAGGSYLDSVAFHEKALELSVVMSFGRGFAASFKYMHVEQGRSEWYDFEPTRRQYIGALRLFGFYTPSFMVVPAHVKGDKYSQVYFSPISFTYPF